MAEWQKKQSQRCVLGHRGSRRGGVRVSRLKPRERALGQRPCSAQTGSARVCLRFRLGCVRDLAGLPFPTAALCSARCKRGQQDRPAKGAVIWKAHAACHAQRLRSRVQGSDARDPEPRRRDHSTWLMMLAESVAAPARRFSTALSNPWARVTNNEVPVSTAMELAAKKPWLRTMRPRRGSGSMT